VYNPFKIQV